MDLTRFDGHTPGPWRWEFNGQHKCLHLVGGEVRHDLTVIGFSRWGMGGATMQLRDLSHDGMNLLYRVHERADWIKPEPGREHHKHWHQLLDHRDACLIEAAPELLSEVRRLTDKVADLLRERDELKAEVAESDAVREQLADLLHRTAIAVRGPEPELTRWSWHDVPDRVAAAIAALGGAMQAAVEATLERDAEAARLAEIEAQPPVAWQSRFTDGGGWANCSERHARMVAAPVLEVRACGCSQAKAGRCVMGDYGALPVGTKLYAGRVSEPTDIEAVLRDAVDRAVDQCADATGQRAKIATFVNRTEIVNAAIAQIHGDAPTCETKGLLGASSGVGRECDYWAGGVCTSPEPCQHQQPVKPCRTCGPEGCPDRVSCPNGGAA